MTQQYDGPAGLVEAVRAFLADLDAFSQTSGGLGEPFDRMCQSRDALDAALSTQAGATPGVGELPSVEAFAEALYETDYVEGDEAKGEWALMVSCAAEGPFKDASKKIVVRYRGRAKALRARLAAQSGGAVPGVEELAVAEAVAAAWDQAHTLHLNCMGMLADFKPALVVKETGPKWLAQVDAADAALKAARLASQPGGGPVAAGESDNRDINEFQALIVQASRKLERSSDPAMQAYGKVLHDFIGRKGRFSPFRAALGASSGGEGSRG